MHVTWKIQLNTELGFIDIVHSGILTRQQSQDATKEALARAPRDDPHLFLADVLNAESTLSTVDIYGKPTDWEAAGVVRATKLVLVVSKGGSMWEDAVFFETTCRNRGW